MLSHIHLPTTFKAQHYSYHSSNENLVVTILVKQLKVLFPLYTVSMGLAVAGLWARLLLPLHLRNACSVLRGHSHSNAQSYHQIVCKMKVKKIENKKTQRHALFERTICWWFPKRWKEDSKDETYSLHSDAPAGIKAELFFLFMPNKLYDFLMVSPLTLVNKNPIDACFFPRFFLNSTVWPRKGFLSFRASCATDLKQGMWARMKE